MNLAQVLFTVYLFHYMTIVGLLKNPSLKWVIWRKPTGFCDWQWLRQNISDSIHPDSLKSLKTIPKLCLYIKLSLISDVLKSMCDFCPIPIIIWPRLPKPTILPDILYHSAHKKVSAPEQGLNFIAMYGVKSFCPRVDSGPAWLQLHPAGNVATVLWLIVPYIASYKCI